MTALKRNFITISLLTLMLLSMVLFAGSFSDDSKAYALSPGQWEVEENNTLGLANKIAVNYTYHGKISGYYDYDCYFFDLGTRGTVALDLRHPGKPTEEYVFFVEIYDKSGERIAFDWVEGWETAHTTYKVGLLPGRYFIKISPAIEVLYEGYSNLQYSINVKHTVTSTWECELNNNRPLADRITLNKKYYGNMIDTMDEDYYKFSLDSKSKVTLKFDHGYVNSDYQLWAVRLLNADNESLGYKVVKGGDGPVSLNYSSLPAGTYYVCVDVYSTIYYSRATYSLNVMTPATAAPASLYVKRIAHDNIKAWWSKVSGASGYYVYVKKTKNSKWTYYGSTTGTSFRTSNLTDGALYHVKVVPYVKNQMALI